MTIIGIPVGITNLKLLPSPYGQLAVESFRWKWRSKPEWLMLNASIGNTEFFCFRGFVFTFVTDLRRYAYNSSLLYHARIFIALVGVTAVPWWIEQPN